MTLFCSELFDSDEEEEEEEEGFPWFPWDEVGRNLTPRIFPVQRNAMQC